MSIFGSRQVLLLLVITGVAIFDCSATQNNDRPVVTTSSGKLKGTVANVNGHIIQKFLGVPYGQPPVGPLRFRPSLPIVNNADAVIDTSNFRASCMQPPHLRQVIYKPLHADLNESFVSEDCLYLNVYVPENENSDNKKAVMVWLPGEGFSFGYANQYDGSYLAVHGDVIVVTVNYRLSVFGFLSTGDNQAPGNIGLMDQMLALRWLKNNVGKFGGDPDNITVFGRLTGSISISALMASPYLARSGKPLFNRAVLQSGVANGNWIFESRPLQQARAFALEVNCTHVATETSTTTELIRCLQEVPAETLLASSFSIPTQWRLVSGTDFLPEWPLNANLPKVDVMLGTTGHEGSMCFLMHLVMKTEYTDKLLNDTLTQDDLEKLVEDHVKDYAGEMTSEELLEAVKELYSCESKDTDVEISCRQQFLEFCGDMFSDSATLKMANKLSKDGNEVYRYEFNHRPSFSHYPEFIKAAQGDEVIFIFGLVEDPSLESVATKAEFKLSRQMMNAWSNFAKRG